MPRDFKTEAEREAHFEQERADARAAQVRENRQSVVTGIMRGLGYTRAKAERLASKMLGERPRDPLAGRFG